MNHFLLVISYSENNNNLEKLSNVPNIEIVNITLTDFILIGKTLQHQNKVKTLFFKNGLLTTKKQFL